MIIPHCKHTHIKLINDLLTDDEFTRQNLVHAEQMQKVKCENHALVTLLMKMKAFTNWKENHTKGLRDQSVSKHLSHTVKTIKPYPLCNEPLSCYIYIFIINIMITYSGSS